MDSPSEPEPQSASGTIWEYRDELARLARRLCHDANRAEDIAHSTLLRAIGANRSGEVADLRRWLHRIAALECLAARRGSRDRSLENLVEHALESSLPDEPPVDDDLGADLDRVRAILAAVERLPDRSRTAFILRDGAGKSFDEIASLLGTTAGGAKALVHRARVAVRKDLPRDL